MCFKAPKVDTAPDKAYEAQKYATFLSNSSKATEEKDARTDLARSKAYGFYGTRSLVAGAGSAGLLAPGAQLA